MVLNKEWIYLVRVEKNCDILLMSATPIPRTMMMTVYGDMDISILREKPLDRKPVLTYSKPEKKIDEVINYVEKQINLNNQVFLGLSIY